ncbi:MAG TPA: ABC transporter permease [Candidatus Acidoferrum sp.]|nr:ABC transporter permease [Candidatus Acidoferrum sp.]
MSTIWQDLRYAIRVLAKSPGFTAVAVLTLALGIGANTAIFSILYGVLLRPLPFHEPDHLYGVTLNLKGELSETSFTFHQFEYIKQHSQWYEGMAASTPVGFNLSAEGTAQRVTALHITSDYFKVLGAQPYLGRDFQAEDDRAGSAPTAILSHHLWQQHFGRETSIVGKTIRLDGEPYLVIGVMPAGYGNNQSGFVPSEFAQFQHVDLWAMMAPVAKTIGSGENLDVIARLKPGVTPEQARAQIDALSDSFRKDQLEGRARAQNLALYSLQKVIGGEVSSYLWILLGAVSFVLLIACANVANLLLARGAGRLQEVAVRTAMGATRGRLIRQFLTESLLLALAGAGAGLLLAQVSFNSLLALAPVQLPRLNEIHVDLWAFLFAVSIAVSGGILFGMAPAIQAARTDVHSMLKIGTSRSTAGSWSGRMRGALVAAEIALSLILLVGAGLLGETLLNLLRVPAGIDPKGVLSAEIWLTGSRYRSTAELATFFETVANRLKSIPGVQNATVVASGQPLERGGNIPVKVNGAFWGSVEYRVVTPEYFRTLHVAMLQGHEFTAADTETSQPIAIVNQAFVRDVLSFKEPLGASVKAGNSDPARVIVGVAADVRSHLDAPAGPAVFVPAAQANFSITLLFDQWFPTHVLVRTSGDPLLPEKTLAGVIQETDPSIPVGKIRTMDEILARSLSYQRFMLTLVSVFAGLAMILAAIGIYGVMSYTVVQRTRELGVRTALGATPRSILLLVLGEGSKFAMIGTVIGIIGAVALHRTLQSLLFGVRATSVLTLGAAAAFLFAVALLACYLPARRATRVDPLVALRYE